MKKDTQKTKYCICKGVSCFVKNGARGLNVRCETKERLIRVYNYLVKLKGLYEINKSQELRIKIVRVEDKYKKLLIKVKEQENANN